MRLALAVLSLVIGSCTLQASISAAERTQAAVTALAQANGMLTSTFAARTPIIHTRAPTPQPFASSIATSPAGGTPPPVPVTGATETTIATCNHPMTTATPGPRTLVLINNRTDAKITFIMGLSAPNFLGDCGYITKAGIPAGKSTTVNVPWSDPPANGPCYWVRAVIPGPKHTSSSESEGGFCLVNAPRWIINVTDHGIRLVKP